MNNNQNSKKDEPQDLGNRMNKDPQQDPSGDPMVALEMSNSMEDPNY